MNEISLPNPANLIEAIKSRDLIEAEKHMLAMPQAECSVIHHFGPGLYVREVHMPSGILAIGHYQKYKHLNVFLKGRVMMFKDDGTAQELVAPMLFCGDPGRKCGYVIEDVVWQNIYATDETDIDKLEEKFLDKSPYFSESKASFEAFSYAEREADRADYAEMLTSVGFTEEIARKQSEDMSDQIPFPYGSFPVKTGKSSINDTGLIATSSIARGAVICPARIDGKRTPAGRFTNHAKNPNAEMILRPNGDIDLVALCDIRGCQGGIDGEEITIDYRKALALSGIGDV